jgi:hypothetical protein
LDSGEDIDEGLLASTDVFGRLEDLGSKCIHGKGIKKDTDGEENSNTCKDDLCWWKYLPYKY